MTSVRICILLGFLATSAMAFHLEFRELDLQESGGNETGKDLWRFEEKVDGQLPGVCWACKWIVNKVKKSLPRDNSEKQVHDLLFTPCFKHMDALWIFAWSLMFYFSHQNEVRDKLHRVCDKIGFLKSLCKKFVTKTIDILVEELSTTDDAKTICVKVRACSSK
uniref:Saposin B-type domain-containing protein n=1 Tax=Scleropages formosus TaxID=113540 RepID=A0A8C9VXI6_SCLFO